jgi:hypothetical protein
MNQFGEIPNFFFLVVFFNASVSRSEQQEDERRKLTDYNNGIENIWKRFYDLIQINKPVILLSI